MKKLIILIIIPVVLIILFSVFVNNKTGTLTPQFSEQPQEEGLLLEEQKDERGEVGVVVIPMIDPDAKKWEFKVTLDTHSVALDQDMTQVSVLLDDVGTSHLPIAWEGAEPGGHHREGVLKFNPITPEPNTLTLKIKGIGGIQERTFQWQLN